MVNGSLQSNPELSVGHFRFCPITHILKSDSDDLPLEPKVGEVLTYLHSNQNRYVSLNELHEKVWVGRVVSDTAVRKTISKLRACLVHSGCEIKSLPRRGYCLDVSYSEPQPIQTRSNELDSIAGGSFSASATSTLPHVPNQPSASKPSGKWTKQLAVLTSLCFFISISVFAIRSSLEYLHNKSNDLEFRTLETFPSQKQAVAVSDDQSLIAFSARNAAEGGFQLYLKDVITGQIHQLTTDGFNIIFLDFINQDNTIAFIDYAKGKAALYTLALPNDMSGSPAKPKQITERFKAMGEIIRANNNSVLSSVMKDESGALVHKIDLNSGDMLPVTHSNVSPVVDYSLALSPHSQTLAYVRGAHTQSDNQLHIMQLANGNISQRFQLNRRVLSLAWQNDQSLLLLDEQEFYRFNIVTGEKQTLLDNTQGIYSQLLASDNNQYFILREAKNSKQLTEAKLGEKLSRNTMLNTGRSLYSGHYGNQTSHKIYITKQEGKYNVISEEASKKIIIYTSNKQIEYLDYNVTTNEYLLRDDDQLVIFNLNNSNKTVLSSKLQLVEDARFSITGNEVIYTERVLDNWQLMSLDLKTHRNKVLALGYRSFRITETGFLAASPLGELFQLDASFHVIKSLNVTLAFDLGQTWHYANQLLVWSDTDTQSTQLHILNLKTDQRYTIHDAYVQMRPQFSLSPDAQSILYMSSGVNNTDILAFSID